MKIGIVGYGSIGQRHAHNLEQIGHQVRVYDPLHRRDHFAREKDLYDWCDAAVICTPSWMHPGGLRACVERNKHCLIEKPICTSSPDAIEPLLVEAKRKNLVVMMGNNLRFHPCVLRMEAELKCWKVAKVVPTRAAFACIGPVSPGNRHDGVLLNTGSHEVDLAMHLLGPATVDNVIVVREHIAAFTLKHSNGCISGFLLGFDDEENMRVAAVMDADDNRINVDLIACVSSTDSWDIDYVREAGEFIARCRGEPPHVGATGDDGLATLRVLLDVKKKALQ